MAQVRYPNPVEADVFRPRIWKRRDCSYIIFAHNLRVRRRELEVDEGRHVMDPRIHDHAASVMQLQGKRANAASVELHELVEVEPV